MLTLVQIAAAIRVQLQFEVWQEFKEIQYMLFTKIEQTSIFKNQYLKKFTPK